MDPPPQGNNPDQEVKKLKPPDLLNWSSALHALAATLTALATLAIALQGCN